VAASMVAVLVAVATSEAAASMVAVLAELRTSQAGPRASRQNWRVTDQTARFGTGPGNK